MENIYVRVNKFKPTDVLPQRKEFINRCCIPVTCIFCRTKKNDITREYVHRNYNVAVAWLNRNLALFGLTNLRARVAIYFLWTDSDDHTGKLLRLPMITKRNYVRSISVASDKKRIAVVVVIVLQRESEASAFSISLIGSFVQSNSTPPPLRL